MFALPFSFQSLLPWLSDGEIFVMLMDSDVTPSNWMKRAERCFLASFCVSSKEKTRHDRSPEALGTPRHY